MKGFTVTDENPNKSFFCNYCLRKGSISNISRHQKSFHLLCAKCFKLSSKARHPHFGAKLLSRSKLLKQAYPPDFYFPVVSGIWVPVELRGDIYKAMQMCLVSRELLDQDIWTVGMFLLAILRRGCLACMAGKEGENGCLSEFHNCRLTCNDVLDKYFELACLLFNINPDMDARIFLHNYLQEHSYG